MALDKAISFVLAILLLIACSAFERRAHCWAGAKARDHGHVIWKFHWADDWFPGHFRPTSGIARTAKMTNTTATSPGKGKNNIISG